MLPIKRLPHPSSLHCQIARDLGLDPNEITLIFTDVHAYHETPVEPHNDVDPEIGWTTTTEEVW